MIVAIDDFSKYAVLGCLKSLKSREVTKWVLTQVLAYFGRAHHLRVDNGNEFKDVFQTTMDSLGINIYRTRVHSPWQNGRAERLIRTVKGMIRRIMQRNPSAEW
jgi:IS30 family transposase